MNLSLKYTKHYYTPTKLSAGIGTERISSVTDTKSNLGYFIENLSYNDFFPVSTLRAMSNAQVEAAGEALEEAYDHFGLQYSVPTPVLEGSKPTPGYTDFNNASIGRYFFHPDHLGSSSYITDKAGVVSQHMEYLPFGELLVDEHLNSHNSPFKFNAKELDPETGNYYYGARYYDPKWSIWLSVDPLAEEFPGWSPYSYTFQNPIKFTDPTGMFPVGGGKNPIFGQQRTTRVSGKQQTFNRLSNAAILTLSEGTGIRKEILKDIWISVDQKVHDNSTGYKSGAITLGKYIFFTEDYDNASTREWLEILGHEVKHSEQARQKGPSGYIPEYLFLSQTTALKEWTLDKNTIHDNHPMEIWANYTEKQFKDFLDSFNYQDKEGNRGNHIIDIFDDNNIDDNQKVYYLQEIFNARKEKQYENRDKG